MTRSTVVFAGGVRVDKLALPTALLRRAFELVGASIPVRIGGSPAVSVGPRRHYTRDGLLASLLVTTQIDIVCAQQL